MKLKVLTYYLFARQLKDEYDQVCLVTAGIIDPGWIEKIGPSGFSIADGQFLTKTGRPLTIRATWSDQMGREQVQAFASKLISDQPTRCIAMSGICAGRREDNNWVRVTLNAQP